MDAIIEFFTVLLALIRQFTWKDALDILVVTFIIYSAVKLVRETRAGQLVKGLLILVAVYLMAWYLDLTMLNELLNYFFQFTVVAFLVIFQPEICPLAGGTGKKKTAKPAAPSTPWPMPA